MYIIVVIVLKSGRETENDGFNFNMYSLNLYFRHSDVGNATKNKGLLDDSFFVDFICLVFYYFFFFFSYFFYFSFIGIGWRWRSVRRRWSSSSSWWFLILFIYYFFFYYQLLTIN
jgi:hypothetical protein